MNLIGSAEKQALFAQALDIISNAKAFSSSKRNKLESLNKSLADRASFPDERVLNASQQVSIVTAANEKFINCAQGLLRSLQNQRGISSIIVFDIGLTQESIASLESLGDKIIISRDLAPCPEWNEEYINYYRFKIEAAAFAPLYDSQTNHFLWLDACSLVVNQLDEVIEHIRRHGHFACQPDERLPGVRMINHVPQRFGNPDLRFLNLNHILARQLIHFGVHGYTFSSDYYENVIYEALLTSMLSPSSVEGEKFPDRVSTEARARIEQCEEFKKVIRFLDERKVWIRSPTWNGARHDLFLFSFLFYRSGYKPLPQYGLMEDHDTKGLSKTNSLASIIPQSTSAFDRSMLWSEKTPIILHRGRFC